MIDRIDYLIKHVHWIQRAYVVVFSCLFRFLGLFVKTDPHQVIFQSMSGQSFGDNVRPLFERMKAESAFAGYKFVWAFADVDKFQVEGARKVKLNSPSYFLELLRSGIWISNASIDRGLQFKPKGTIYLNTWHGIPIKHIGTAHKERGYYNYANVDFMTCSCEFERQVYIRDFGARPEALHKCGAPRDDVLYHVTEEKIQALREKYGIPQGKKVILYAPTWRESMDGGKSFQVAPPLDIEKWREKLSGEYVVIVRMHFITTQMLDLQYDDFVRNGSLAEDINDLLMIADILISDYSSSFFDYSILERPIVSYAYDYEEYARERGVYEDIHTVLPGDVFSTEDEVIDHILHMDREAECRRARALRERFIESDGHAVDACMAFLKEKTAAGC